MPGSKSYTNRALLVAALAEGESRLTGALFSDDTEYMSSALRELGVTVVADADSASFEVTGNGGKVSVYGARLFIGNSGTTARSLISYVALGEGTFVIDGDEPMRKSRPISDLLDALVQLGVDARSEQGNGCLPVVVKARGFRGGGTKLDASKSSQFLSSLLLTAPYAEDDVNIEIASDYKTQYIDITLSIMEAWGVAVEHEDYRRFHVAGGQSYRSQQYVIEPDASSASYFFGAAALCGGRVLVKGISESSAQGDIRFVDVLEQMGCTVNRYEDGTEVVGPDTLRGIEVDMKGVNIPTGTAFA